MEKMRQERDEGIAGCEVPEMFMCIIYPNPPGPGARDEEGPRGRSGQLLHNLGITRVESDGIGTGGNRIDVVVIKVKVVKGSV